MFPTRKMLDGCNKMETKDVFRVLGNEKQYKDLRKLQNLGLEYCWTFFDMAVSIKQSLTFPPCKTSQPLIKLVDKKNSCIIKYLLLEALFIQSL